MSLTREQPSKKTFFKSNWEEFNVEYFRARLLRRISFFFVEFTFFSRIYFLRQISYEENAGGSKRV